MTRTTGWPSRAIRSRPVCASSIGRHHPPCPLDQQAVRRRPSAWCRQKAATSSMCDRLPFLAGRQVGRNRRCEPPGGDRRDRFRRRHLAEAAQDQRRIAGRIVGREAGNDRLDGADRSARTCQLMAQDRRHERLADACANRRDKRCRHRARPSHCSRMFMHSRVLSRARRPGRYRRRDALPKTRTAAGPCPAARWGAGSATTR